MSAAPKPAVPRMPERQLTLLTLFGDNFLEHHAGRIISDPETAIVELVANCSDAGADRVEIEWPDSALGTLSISDNGIGMTPDEFEIRWRTLNYDRRQDFGNSVKFPPGVRHRPRQAFGRAGIGRHAMFCFADEYFVETRRDGRWSSWRVRRSNGISPFDIERVGDGDATTSGTKIVTQVSGNRSVARHQHYRCMECGRRTRSSNRKEWRVSILCVRPGDRECARGRRRAEASSGAGGLSGVAV